LVARGVGGDATVKSTELLFESSPSGIRASLDPGAAVVPGAGAGLPSTNPFAAVAPYPTESMSVPLESRRPIPPAVAARPVAKVWSGVGVPE
jgi:hypothetical protein